jgi:GTPase SAR1 family protein
VTDFKSSFDKAKAWVRELQRQADPSIVIMLVGNKLDMAASRKTSRAMGERFAQEEGLLFCEASAKNGEGVENMFMEIGGYRLQTHLGSRVILLIPSQLASCRSRSRPSRA